MTPTVQTNSPERMKIKSGVFPPDHAGKEKLTANAMKDETGVALSRNPFLYVTNM